ncbi:MAG: hypothetical protein M1480_19790 [Bacteroidetes bacterium]|nr:hypothetical protein [Bacteroidota bacterium]
MLDKLKKILNEKGNKDTIKILVLITASAVLRKEKFFKQLLAYAKLKKINCEKIYEAILQTYLFAGFPVALISLSIFNEYFPSCHNEDVQQVNKNFDKIGEATCRKIYGNKFEKLISNTKKFSPELAEWLIVEGYGKVLSRDVLSLKERELINISILTALKFENQLYSHINGAYRLNTKISTIKEIISCLDILGSNKYNIFGTKVLHKFIEQKRVK